MSPRKGRPAPDPRHAAVKAFLERYWRQETGLGDIPWGAADAGAVGQFLRANPTLSVDVIERCIANRATSDDHAPGERFYRWIGDLLRYAAGPLDRYRLPKKAHSEATVGMQMADSLVPSAVQIDEMYVDGERADPRAYFVSRARQRKAAREALTYLDRQLLREEGEL